MKQKLRSIIFFVIFTSISWFGVYTALLVFKAWGLLSTRDLAYQIVFAMSVLVPAIMPMTISIANRSWNSMNAVVSMLVTPWIGVSMSAFMASMLFALLSLAIPEVPVLYWGVATIMSVVWYVTYGVINAARAHTRFVSIPARDSLVGLAGQRVALVSDLHLGLIRQHKFAKRVVARIMKESPDMIIIAGDLIDGPIFPYEAALAPLSGLNAPLGVYFTPGNHEHYNPENDKFYAALPANITPIVDLVIPVPGTQLSIAGIDYRSQTDQEFSIKAAEILGDASPSIIILHDPKHRQVLSGKTGLVLSGHTHAGQTFPATILMRLLYGKKSKGLVVDENTTYYTTVGIGTSLTPIRVGTKPEVVMLDIE